MKRKDIMLILVVVIISGSLSIVLSSLFITSSKNRNTRVEVVEPITYDFQAPPNSKYFNPNSINPTKVIRIGDQANTDPFAGQ